VNEAYPSLRCIHLCIVYTGVFDVYTGVFDVYTVVFDVYTVG